MTEREKTIQAIAEARVKAGSYGQNFVCFHFDIIDMILDLLKEQPQIVNCKDCRHSAKFSDGVYSCMVRTVPDGIKYRKPDWYCADGERRDSDAR